MWRAGRRGQHGFQRQLPILLRAEVGSPRREPSTGCWGLRLNGMNEKTKPVQATARERSCHARAPGRAVPDLWR